MTIWKKAISTLATASLLASLFATAFAGSTFAATTATVPANAISSVAATAASLGPVSFSAGSTDISTTGTITVTLPTGYTWATSGTITTAETGTTFAVADGTMAGGSTVTFAVTAIPTVTTAATLSFSGAQVKGSPAAATGNVVATYSGTWTGGSLTVATVTSIFGNGPYGTAIPYTTNVASRPADGSSFIDLEFQTTTSKAVTSFVVTGGTFIGGTGAFLTKTGTTINLVPGAITAGDDLYLASTTAGTATVTVSYSDGVQTVDSIQSFTFTAAAAKVVSAGNTTNNFATVGDTSCSAVSAFAVAAVGSSGKAVCTIVRDPDGFAITTGVKVKYTLTGPGSIGTLGSGTYTDSDGTDGFAATIYSSGISGEATIKTTVTYLNVDYALADKTFTFYGAPKTAELTTNAYSVGTECASNDTSAACMSRGATDGLRLLVKDAAGTRVRDLTGWTPSATVAPANLLTVGAAGSYSSLNPGFAIPFTCGVDALQGTVKVKLTKGTDTVETGTVSISCVDILASNAVGEFTVGAAATSLVPGGNTTITVTVKDDNGFPAADGTVVTAAANSGAVVSSDGNNQKKTSNGVATFTFLAPSTAGAATVTAFVSNAGGPNSVSLTIGAAAGGGAVTGTNASALGLSTSGSYSTATKVAALGKYETWKISFGAAAAGKTVGILVATKNSAGVWSSFTRLTGRVADASGTAWFSWRSSSASWISVRGDLDGGLSNAVQGRWK
ncbi:MAG: hypothetical protein HYX54_09605 [Chloroflexi bacterium]|nr:hypothetical protein [Chloroflexota bacterium]